MNADRPTDSRDPEVTLRVRDGQQEIFASRGKWLHPLFELEEFLLRSSCRPETLLLEDKIMGKAAALLVVRLGIRRVRAGVLSRLGLAVLESNGIDYTAEQIVERIDCRTESLLSEVEEPEQAYALLKERAVR